MSTILKKYIPYAIILAVILFVIKFCIKKDESEDIVHISHNTVVQEIESLGRLEVVKYNIKDVIEYEKVRNWLPNSRTALIVSGEVIGCIDLNKLNEKDIYTSKDSVSIKLPAPEVCSFKIDHSKSRVYNVENGWWETTDLIDAAYRHAEQQLYKQAENMGLTRDCEANAQKVVAPLLRQLGFNKIHIEFYKKDQKQSFGSDN